MLLASAESQSLPPLAFYGNATRFGQLLANGVPFSLKGVTWPGLETELTAPLGLDKHNIAWYMNWLRGHKFNAIRLLVRVLLHRRLHRTAVSSHVYDSRPTWTTPHLGRDG